MAARRSLASRGATVWSTKPGVLATSHRIVFTKGVPFGTAHVVEMDGSVTRERTLCGGWPGREPRDDQTYTECPVCFKER